MTVRRLGSRIRVLLGGLLAVAAVSGASAYTPEQQQACSGDAFRLCSAAIPDVDRVTLCMIQNQSQLSPECRVFFRAPEAEVPVAARPPLSLRPTKVRQAAQRKAKAVRANRD